MIARMMPVALKKHVVVVRKSAVAPPSEEYRSYELVVKLIDFSYGTLMVNPSRFGLYSLFLIRRAFSFNDSEKQ